MNELVIVVVLALLLTAMNVERYFIALRHAEDLRAERKNAAKLIAEANALADRVTEASFTERGQHLTALNAALTSAREEREALYDRLTALDTNNPAMMMQTLRVAGGENGRPRPEREKRQPYVDPETGEPVVPVGAR